MNYNDSWDEHSRDCGIGVIACGANGQIVDGLNRHIKREGGEEIKALAVLESVKLAKHRVWQRTVVETDSLSVAYQLLGSPKHKNWITKSIIDNILHIVASLPSVTWKHIPRVVNECVNWTARQAKQRMCTID